ncbi:MAG: hypothetical protein H6923_08195 [Alphaproteobacteria bacterium]|nr:hypothetical protein [Alphaproteobacteria bacterium]
MPSRVLFAGLTLFAALALMGLTARAAEPPHIMAFLEPWLESVASLETTTEAHLNSLSGAPKDWRRLALLDGGYAARLERFTYETDTLSAALRDEPAGSEPACILKGLALDLTEKSKTLREAGDATAAREALAAIAQLLREPRLIFAGETAFLAPRLVLAADVQEPCPNFGDDGGRA